MINSTANEVVCIPVKLAIELKCGYLAMIVQFFINVISHHKRLKRNFKLGSTWNYCTRAELSAQFPFLSSDQVKRMLAKLVKMNILKVGNFNKKPGDNTNWYAFTDECRWGLATSEEIDKMSGDFARGSGDFARPPGEIAQAIPLTNHRLTHISKVNDSKVDDAATPSLTASKEKKRTSLTRLTAKFSQEQREALDFLKSAQIDTSQETIAWWSRKYGLDRLREVHAEAVNRKAKSIGAYMQKLLKKGAVVTTGRVEQNALAAQQFKDLFGWENLEIHKKYASIKMGNHDIEIDFNMKTDDFNEFLLQKYKSFIDQT